MREGRATGTRISHRTTVLLAISRGSTVVARSCSSHAAGRGPIAGSDVNFLHTTFSVRRGPASWVVDPEHSLRCTRRSGPLSIRDGPLHPPNFTPRRNPCQPHPHLATNEAGSAYSRDLPARTANQFHPRSGMLLYLADYRPWQQASATLSDHPTRSRRPWKCRSRAGRRSGGLIDLLAHYCWTVRPPGLREATSGSEPVTFIGAPRRSGGRGQVTRALAEYRSTLGVLEVLFLGGEERLPHVPRAESAV